MTWEKRGKIAVLSVFLFMLALVSGAEARPRLAVRSFEDRSQEGGAPAAAITDMMVTELDKAQIFDLVERERLDTITSELSLAQSGLMDPATAPQLGKLKGAQYTMTGSITLYFYNRKKTSNYILLLGNVAEANTAYVMLDLRVISNTTGQVLYAAGQQGSAKQKSRTTGFIFPGFITKNVNEMEGGLLAQATYDAVLKHVEAMKGRQWD